VVGFPTETFYGLGVDALDAGALDRLRAVKGRGAEKAISVLVTEAMLEVVVAEVSPRARALMAAHWPGPLTLALPARPGLPEGLVMDGCVAVRWSPHPLAQRLVEELARPITATSANPAGVDPPSTPEGVEELFEGRCRVIHAGATPGGAPSTLVRVRGTRIEVLRQGALDISRE
jgi:L-threonylcarbamoyladenylate synthase